MPDHVHLACFVPPAIAVALFIKAVKGGSAHFVNHLPDVQGNFGRCLYWQPGYWGMTYTKRDLPRIVAMWTIRSSTIGKAHCSANWNTFLQSRRDFPSRKISPAIHCRVRNKIH